MINFGVTERGDAGLDQSWREKVDKYDGILLITKAPHLIGPLPDNAILHCTITGYGSSFLEPGGLPYEKTLRAYDMLVDKYGSERVVLRIDPIISIYDVMITMSFNVAKRCRGRLRVSFLDLYPHVKKRLSVYDSEIMDFPFHDSKERRNQILDDLKDMVEDVEVCGEPDMESTGCISHYDLELLGLLDKFDPNEEVFKQRKTCECIVNKRELLRNRERCQHNCMYCYWKDRTIGES